MPDHAAPELPRIAFVFGDAGSAAHVREAMDGYAEIAYDALQGEFDVSRLRDAEVAAVLVNVDGGDWLGEFEGTLRAVGMPMVFNDPAISQRLDGWDRARWRRHLLAKIRGSTDVDPPRPVVPVPDEAGSAGESARVPGDVVPDATQDDGAVVERPLSPHEIETLTANFVAPQFAPQGGAGWVSPQPTVAVKASTEPDDPAADDPAAEEPASMIDDVGETTDAGDRATETGLDVDTEALSAMIDARLAEPACGTTDSGEVWRIADDGVAVVQQADGTGSTPEAGTPAEGEATTGTDGAPSQDGSAQVVAANADVAPVEEADVLAGLPSLDDWELVDTDAMPASGAPKPTPADSETALAASLTDIELVPMEPIVPQAVHTEPIERWLQGESESRRKTDRKADGEDRA